MIKASKPKAAKLKFKLSRADGHRSEFDADLGARGVALAELFSSAVCFGEDAVPGLKEVLDTFIASRGP